MDLNVKGIFTATRAASECMIAKGSGVILSTSSMVSISGQASGLAYPTSKFAVNGLTVSLAWELGPRGIRVNAVAPGITETDMMKAVPKEVMDPLVRQIPLRRLGKPEGHCQRLCVPGFRGSVLHHRRGLKRGRNGKIISKMKRFPIQLETLICGFQSRNRLFLCMFMMRRPEPSFRNYAWR